MMKLIVLLALVFSGTSSTTIREDYNFDTYLSDFNHRFQANELNQRKEIFNKELKRVQEHNKKNLSWKETVNEFSVLTPAEKLEFTGRSKDVAQGYQAKPRSEKSIHDISTDFKILPIEKLPKSVDWREKGVVTPAKDQGRCGACWAFGAVEEIESMAAISSGNLFELSVQQATSCAPNPNGCGGIGGCRGSTAELAYDYIAKTDGIYQEHLYEYGSGHKAGVDHTCDLPKGLTKPLIEIGGYVKLPSNNYTMVMNALAHVGPLAVTVAAGSWYSYHSGVFEGCDFTKPDVNHVVQLVGYGEEEETGLKYWIVRNSWGPRWGEDGYLRIVRREDEEKQCGVDNTPQHGVACFGQTAPVKVCGNCAMLYDVSYPVDVRISLKGLEFFNSWDKNRSFKGVH